LVILRIVQVRFHQKKKLALGKLGKTREKKLWKETHNWRGEKPKTRNSDDYVLGWHPQQLTP
jgi:hypothetical protein